MFGAGVASIVPHEPHILLQIDQAIESGLIPAKPIILFRRHPMDALDRWISTLQQTKHTITDDAWQDKDKVKYFNIRRYDFERLVSRENPFCRANLKGKFIKEGKSPYNQNTTYVGVTNDPQSWDLSLQCSLWTSTYKTRDDFMAKILISFKGGTLYLPWLPDPLDTDDVYWQEVRMDMNFSDETEVEGLDEKDPRAIIRTTFNLKTTVTLPYFIFWIPAIKSIQINDETFVTNSFQRMDVVTEPGIDPLQFVINPVSLTF